MSPIPEFEIGLWNGWILSAVFLVANYGFFFIGAAKENVKEMMDQVKEATGRDKLVCNLAYVPQWGIYVYSVFLPLKLDSSWFYIGLALFALGMIGEIIAVAQLFLREPGQLMTRGLYRFSRNPGYVGWAIVCIGIGIATASWVILALAVFSMTINHFIVLGEERLCLEKYGDPYREYMTKVPRYARVPRTAG